MISPTLHHFLAIAQRGLNWQGNNKKRRIRNFALFPCVADASERDLVEWSDSPIHSFFTKFFVDFEPALTTGCAQTDPRSMSPQQVQAIQREKLNMMLAAIRDRPFFASFLKTARLADGDPIESNIAASLAMLPITTKRDLIAAGRCAPARNFDLPRDSYTRLHQTSGTAGYPMTVLDTPDDWQWWLRCWGFVLDAAEVTDRDVALMAFSFGPFIGFWTAHDALVGRRAMVVPSGGMSSESRLQMIDDHKCTLVCCTPTYALHLAVVANRIGMDLTTNSVTRIIVAGEPGGSVPAIRTAIESSWGARVIDHAGASEVGAWGFASTDGLGLHVIETEFIAECLVFSAEHPEGKIADEGEPAELVLTNLGRLGGPVIRYRTGDIVRGYRNHDRSIPFLWLDGGVIGRADDMMVVRGVNIFPSSVEAIIRELEPTAEYRVIVSRENQMDQLAVDIEVVESSAEKIAELLRDRLAMRIAVTPVSANSLPRFEAKSKRVFDRRNSGANQ